MRRKLIALAAAAALTATGFVAPAQARDRGETAAIVAGVAALAIVGATLASDRNNNHRRHDGHVSRGYDGRHGYYAPPRHRGYYAPPRHRGYYVPPRHRGYRDHGYRSHRGYRYGHDNAGNRYRHDGR
jgi:hypothetical protein